MPDFAFSGGVKPGGLTSSTEIRILLCYLLNAVGEPLTKDEIETALLEQELVNYFEYASALGALVQNGLVSELPEGFMVTEKGARAAQDLSTQVPRAVREKAVRSAVLAMQFSKKLRQNRASVKKISGGGYMVHCEITDIGGPVFSFDLAMPDEATASEVCRRFAEVGPDVYRVMTAALTGSRSLLEDSLDRLTKPEN